MGVTPVTCVLCPPRPQLDQPPREVAHVSPKASVQFMARYSTTMVSLLRRAVSSLILTVAVVALCNPASSEPSSSFFVAPSSRYSSVDSSSVDFYSSPIGLAAFCNSATQYQDQPAECQASYDQHRLTVFLIPAVCALAFLLAVILVLLVFGD